MMTIWWILLLFNAVAYLADFIHDIADIILGNPGIIIYTLLVPEVEIQTFFDRSIS